MNEIKLTRNQFEQLNTSETFNAIHVETEDSSLTQHQRELTNKLFSEYEFLVVKEDDTIWGFDGHELRFVLKELKVYERAAKL